MGSSGQFEEKGTILPENPAQSGVFGELALFENAQGMTVCLRAFRSQCWEKRPELRESVRWDLPETTG